VRTPDKTKQEKVCNANSWRIFYWAHKMCFFLVSGAQGRRNAWREKNENSARSSAQTNGAAYHWAHQCIISFFEVCCSVLQCAAMRCSKLTGLLTIQLTDLFLSLMRFCQCMFFCVWVFCRVALCCYGVATISRLLKIIGSFAEYRIFYRALLQKRHMI